MEMYAENFVSKPNNNQKKTKTTQKPLKARAAAALFKAALAHVPHRSIHLPGAPRLLSVFYVSTFPHFHTSTPLLPTPTFFIREFLKL
jgi:hypothetical protein